jgi:hypothetical protein
MLEPTNNDRARWANTALSAFVLEVDPHGSNTESENIQDLLTDLRHLADVRGLDIDELWQNSASHYGREVIERPKADASALTEGAN